VLVISQDLDENHRDRRPDRPVIAHGRLSPARPTPTLTRERIGLLMGGRAPEQAAETVDAV